ncbi:MAG: helix-turn-helix domain-containing protein [Phycisphaerae bacterium]
MLIYDNPSHGYLPVDNAVMELGFYVTGVGQVTIRANEPSPQPGHPELYAYSWQRGRVLPEYQLVYIYAGEGEFESTATGVCKVPAGTLLWLMPDVWHRYRPNLRTGWELCWISFNGQIPHIWQRCGVIQPKSAVQALSSSVDLRSQYQRIIDLVVRHPARACAEASFEAMAMLASLFAGIPFIRPASPAIPIAEDELVRDALHIIWTHSHHNLSVARIAQDLRVTRRMLERRFAHAHGKTVLEEITYCRLNRAQRMLAETHLPLKLIAYSAGFASPTRMTVVFRRELKTTPTEYRRQSRRSMLA